MGLFTSLIEWFSPSYQEHETIASATAGKVVITGVIETLEEAEALLCPLTGEPAVMVHYMGRASGMASRAYGIIGDGMEIITRAHQARDFLLRDSSGAALIRVEPGQDLIQLHGRMFETHGIEMKAETDYLAPGERVTVQGKVVERHSAGSPHRRAPYQVVVKADSITRVEEA